MTTKNLTLPITGMTCASCVRRVERALSKFEHTESTQRQYALRDRALALVSVANPGGMKGAFSGQCSIIGLPVHPAFGGVPGAPVRRLEATDL